MARNPRNRGQQEEATPVEVEASAPAAASQETTTMNDTTTAPVAAPAPNDERYRMVPDKALKGDGSMVKRSDYMKALYVEKKWSRGQIRKHISEITGKDIKFQIVYAATKGLKGGPDKPAEGAPSTEGAAA